MRKWLKKYPSKFRDDLNVGLITKSSDQPLVDYIVDSWKSLQIVKGIKFLGYEWTEKMSEFEMNKYIFKRQKGRKKNEKYDYKWIEDNKVGLLTIHLLLTTTETDFESGKTVTKEKKIKKGMLVPIEDEDGYFFIRGKKYYLIYQMVEKSTYTSANSVILKSLMPFAIRRKTIDCEDMKGNFYTLPYYCVELFRKDQPVMLVYASKGMNAAIQFALECFPYTVMSFVKKYDEEDKKNLYFGISNKLFIKVNKKLFKKYVYVRSVVGGILEISSTRTTYEKLDDEVTWIKKLSQSNVEKGKGLLISLQRLMDETTKKILRVDIYNKLNVYHVIRWMTQEFNVLRMKDNMDLKNKRLCCKEYVSSLLTNEFSYRLNQVISLGDKATMTDYMDIFKFTPELLIQRMHASGVFKYDETINDMTFFSKCKYTVKGPRSAGAKNKNSIGVNYRGLHPSFIGYIDLTVCGNSDPGTSGVLTPYSDMDGFYFDNSPEPDDFRFEFMKDAADIVKENNGTILAAKVETKEEYYDIINRAREFTEKLVSIRSVSRKGNYDVVVEEEEDLEEPKEPKETKEKKK